MRRSSGPSRGANTFRTSTAAESATGSGRQASHGDGPDPPVRPGRDPQRGPGDVQGEPGPPRQPVEHGGQVVPGAGADIDDAAAAPADPAPADAAPATGHRPTRHRRRPADRRCRRNARRPGTRRGPEPSRPCRPRRRARPAGAGSHNPAARCRTSARRRSAARHPAWSGPRRRLGSADSRPRRRARLPPSLLASPSAGRTPAIAAPRPCALRPQPRR